MDDFTRAWDRWLDHEPPVVANCVPGIWFCDMCKKTYDVVEWLNLKLVGSKYLDGYKIEMRHCTCGLTFNAPEARLALDDHAGMVQGYDGEWRWF